MKYKMAPAWIRGPAGTSPSLTCVRLVLHHGLRHLPASSAHNERDGGGMGWGSGLYPICSHPNRLAGLFPDGCFIGAQPLPGAHQAGDPLSDWPRRPSKEHGIPGWCHQRHRVVLEGVCGGRGRGSYALNLRSYGQMRIVQEKCGMVENEGACCHSVKLSSSGMFWWLKHPVRCPAHECARALAAQTSRWMHHVAAEVLMHIAHCC